MPLTRAKIEELIADHLLEDELELTRRKIHQITSQDTEAWRKATIALLSVLIPTSAAYNLPSPDGKGTVASRLLAILASVKGGKFQYEDFKNLLDQVSNGRTDVYIWEAVVRLITALEELTPHAYKTRATFIGTPVKSNSSRLSNSENRDTVEEELFYEIKDCIHRGVGGFFGKHFNDKSWSSKAQGMLKKVLTSYDGKEKRWKEFPTDPWEKPVWEWLTSLERQAMLGAAHTLHTTRKFKQRKGQADLFFQRQLRKSEPSTYKDVLVVGVYRRSGGDFKNALLQLARYVRSVFTDQPTRRFAHAFLLRNTKMELWVFDRSGLYSSGKFDIHEEPDKFARAIVGYATMDADSLGLDTFIDRHSGHHSVSIANGEDKKKMQLEEILVRQAAIVCRGTTCYRTRQRCVIKLAWASGKRIPEVNHLRSAAENGVEGVANVVAYQQITSIAEQRAGLEFGKRHKFNNLASSPRDIREPLAEVTKRKKRRLTGATSVAKRSRSNSQISALSQCSSSNPPSLYASGQDEPYDNRIYSCLAISPAGRVISSFQTASELLEGLRDAIKAHKSLLMRGSMLHRDISDNNIIITRPEEADGFKGMLIDLDLAKKLNSKPSEARHQTGTIQFMAIEVLRGTDHTYRHDLESFFHVLLWMCARQSWSNGFAEEGEVPLPSSRLRRWEVGNFRDIADAKRLHMYEDGLEDVLEEFPCALDILKPLCMKLRTILFGDTARLATGTPEGEPSKLYEGILVAYNEAVELVNDT